jgi:hypothetical protein
MRCHLLLEPRRANLDRRRVRYEEAVHGRANRKSRQSIEEWIEVERYRQRIWHKRRDVLRLVKEIKQHDRQHIEVRAHLQEAQASNLNAPALFDCGERSAWVFSIRSQSFPRNFDATAEQKTESRPRADS